MTKIEQKKRADKWGRIPQDRMPISRRQLVKAMGFGAASTTIMGLPARWTKPFIEKIMVPLHAQTSEPPSEEPTTTPAGTTTAAPTTTPATSTTAEPTTTPCVVYALKDSAMIPMERLNWREKELLLEQWPPENGPLRKVVITKRAEIRGDAMFENKSSTAEDVTIYLSAEVTITGPNGSLGVQTPTLSEEHHVDAFDGSIDANGPSGRSVLNITASDEQRVTLTDPEKLKHFVGDGYVKLTASAVSKSVVTGPGNIESQFDTFASVGNLEISYECY